MSDAVTALGGASHDGYVRVEEGRLAGMITVRGDLGAAAMKTAVTEAVSGEMPKQRGARYDGRRGVLWMSPDELLVLVPYADAPKTVATLEAALKGTHHLVANVSDARAQFLVSGDAAREVLAKLTPADLSPAGFGPGELRRTRLGQVAAAFWMEDARTFRVICFRSVAQYVFDLLKTAAKPGGEVGYF